MILPIELEQLLRYLGIFPWERLFKLLEELILDLVRDLDHDVHLVVDAEVVVHVVVNEEVVEVLKDFILLLGAFDNGH